MILRRSLRKIIVLLLSLSAVFFVLQVSFIQRYLVSSVASSLVGGDSLIEFDELTGIFPFKFNVKNFSFKTDSLSIKSDFIEIKFRKSIFSIDKLNVGNISIDFSDTSFDIKKSCTLYFPLLVQRFVRKFYCKNAFINKINIGEISIDNNQTYIQMNKMSIRPKDTQEIIILSKFDKNERKIISSINMMNNDCIVSYFLDKNQISIVLKNKDFENIFFDGYILDSGAQGILQTFGVKILSNINVDEHFINMDFETDFLEEHCSCKAQYIFNNNSLLIKKMQFGSIAIADNFLISDNKISDIKIKFPHGIVIGKNIALSNLGTSLGEYSIKDIELSDFQKYFKYKVSGKISGVADLSDKKEKIDIKIRDAKAEQVKVPNLILQGIIRKNVVDLKCVFDLYGKQNVFLIKSDLNNWILQDDCNVNIKCNGMAKIANLFDIGSDALVSGDINYNFFLNGKRKDFKVEGKFIISEGYYGNNITGTIVKNADLHILLNNNKIKIKNISATDYTNIPNKLKGHGEITFKNGRWYVDSLIKIENFKAFDIKGFCGSLNGDITVNGGIGKSIIIGGSLFMKDAKFDISSVIARANRSFDIINENKKLKKNTRIKTQHCSLKINAKFHDVLKIYGGGLDSIWTGGIDISGPLDNPSYDGIIKLSKGKMEVSGKRFSLSDGVVSVNSENPGIFFVNVAASKKVGDIKILAKFLQDRKGTNVSLYSIPSMSQKDILSYFLFDKRASDITQGEGFVLLSVLGKMSGKGDFDILDKFKNVLGLDSLEIKRDIDSNDNEYGALSIGKKLGKIKVSVDQGTAQNTTKVVVEAKVGDRAKVVIDHSSANAIGAGVMWSKRY